MAVDTEAEVTENADTAEPEEKPKRRRKVADEAKTNPARTEPAPDERGHVLRENEDGSPRFSPYVAQLSSKAQRTVRTGQYESFEISTILTFEPDRRFSTKENVSNVNNLITEEVNRVAREIEASLEVQS